MYKIVIESKIKLKLSYDKTVYSAPVTNKIFSFLKTCHLILMATAAIIEDTSFDRFTTDYLKKFTKFY